MIGLSCKETFHAKWQQPNYNYIYTVIDIKCGVYFKVPSDQKKNLKILKCQKNVHPSWKTDETLLHATLIEESIAVIHKSCDKLFLIYGQWLPLKKKEFSILVVFNSPGDKRCFKHTCILFHAWRYLIFWLNQYYYKTGSGTSKLQ